MTDEHRDLNPVQRVFLLWHARDAGNGETDDKLLGVYSSRPRAEERRERTRRVPGFRDFPNGFLIDEYVVDRDEWTEGFV